MATLNTAIRGAQISLSEEVIAVGADSIAFIDADGVMKRDTVADLATAMAGDGLDATSGVFALDLKTSGGLKIDTTELTIEPADFAGTGLKDDGSDNLEVDLYAVGEVAVDVSADSFILADNSDSDATKRDTIADLVTAMAGTGLTATDGVLAVDAVANNIVEGDIQVENMSADIDATGFSGDFTLSNTPLANSVQVFLNGLLQEEGTGKDYTISGTTVSFATAPVSGDIVIAYYIIDN